jgi:hypothetical protein
VPHVQIGFLPGSAPCNKDLANLYTLDITVEYHMYIDMSSVMTKSCCIFVPMRRY